jgi:hypothetical protein
MDIHPVSSSLLVIILVAAPIPTPKGMLRLTLTLTERSFSWWYPGSAFLSGRRPIAVPVAAGGIDDPRAEKKRMAQRIRQLAVNR